MTEWLWNDGRTPPSYVEKAEALGLSFPAHMPVGEVIHAILDRYAQLAGAQAARTEARNINPRRRRK